MGLKNIIGKLVFGELSGELSEFGLAVEQRVVRELNAQPHSQFAELLDLKNLKGESTGYVRAFKADKLEKIASLSIDIMPGMRYFNIHIIPEPHYNIPRYNFEGMVTTKGSQLSMDLYHDMDIVMDFEFINQHYSGLAKTFAKAKKHKSIRLEPSKLPHMRALCSPYFLLANKVSSEDIYTMQHYAMSYLDEWLKIYRQAELLSAEAAETRLDRRLHIARMIIDNDPDRHQVVSTYGEELTQLIERAAMLQ
ncbi:hypothetical protein [Oceanicoccus sagamiensis]|uniref:Uncharacterized protein n=1 Tax=Oceanicoccus sagamiensis TaxID=716816 RepID=A0A1X9N510_9GAMM|nr:hypothetical protein [Oceanicoccus sagamiensis]ARN73200.1 hypothetical protein BST96_03210 [Oceanicoccus sagamiensis]